MKKVVAVACCLLGFAAVLPRMAEAATWYKVGKDTGNDTSTSFLKSQSIYSGWAQSEGGKVDTAHEVAAGNNYVIPKGDGNIVVRTVGDNKDYTFAGDSLTIAGELALNSTANRTLTFANIIADDGIIGDWQGGVTNRIAGTMTIPAGKMIRLKVGGTTRSRCQVISADIVGGGTIRLMGEDNEPPASLVSLSGDASGFTGTIDVDTYPPKKFTLEVSGSFGGTVTALPPVGNVKAIKFNYAGLDSTKGLVIAGEVPEVLKTKLTLTGVEDPTASDLPLMTVPAGVALDSAGFTVSYGTGTFGYLSVQTNQDGSKTLIANHVTQGLPTLSGYTTSIDQRTVTMKVTVTDAGAGTLEVWMHYKDNHDNVNDVLIGTVAPNDTVPVTLEKGLTLPNFGDRIKGGWYVFTTNRLDDMVVTWQSSWSGQSADMAQVLDKATYTWQAVDGEWSGDWTNAAHWACSKPDNMGYPQRADAGSKVTFENVPNGVTATVGVSEGCNPGATFRWHGQSGSTVVLKGLEDGITFERTPEVIDRDFVSLALDHLTLKRSANWPELKNNEVGKERRGISLALRNGAVLTGNYSIILAAPQSSIVVEGGSTLDLSGASGYDKLALGGDGTRMMIDNSTVKAAWVAVPDWQDALNTNIVIEFKGAAPKLIAQKQFDQNDKCADPHLRFFVPVGGYSEAPIQMTSDAAKKFGEKTKPDSTSTAKEIFEIAPESPFLTETSGKRLLQTMPLVTTVTGIETKWMMDFADVVKPKGAGVCTLFYGYEETDIEQSNPTRIFLTLKKVSAGFAILLR